MTKTSPGQQLDQMITGYWTSQAIYAAAKFGIADLLNDGPCSVNDLAEASSTNADALTAIEAILLSVVAGIMQSHTIGIAPDVLNRSILPERVLGNWANVGVFLVSHGS
jgi:hypothetical protein